VDSAGLEGVSLWSDRRPRTPTRKRKSHDVRLARIACHTVPMKGLLQFLVRIFRDRKVAQDSYASAMRRALARKPFLKTNGRYLSRVEAHARFCLR
jgi:hypothetical protein